MSAPGLTAVTTNGNLRLSWPLTGVEYRLEESSDLALTNSWQTSSAVIQIKADPIEAQIPFTNAVRFFRLKK